MQPSAGELEKLLAPIALYPDDLVAQILTAATYPIEVVEAAYRPGVNPVAGQLICDAGRRCHEIAGQPGDAGLAPL